MLAARNRACRWRKYAELPPVNLLASAIAIEEEYTITIPNVSRRSAAHSTPLSYSASGARPGLMLRSIDEPFHRKAKHFSPMPVVTEHVEARAGGRKEHRVAGSRRSACERHRLLHRRRAQDGNAHAGDRRLDEGRVATDEDERARRARYRGLERRKILALAFAAGDEDHLCAAVREPGERGDGRAHVRALGVVVPAHALRLADRLDAVREPLELAQRLEQGLERQPESATERERGERVGRVVESGELHLTHGEQRVPALREPVFAATLDHAPILVAARRAEPEGDRPSPGLRHRKAARIVAVEHLQAAA